MRHLGALRLLEDLLERGCQVRANREEGKVAVAPSRRLSRSLRRRIRDAKPGLIDVLDPSPPTRPCGACESLVFVRRAVGDWRCMECWTVTADDAVAYFFGPLNWARQDDVR